MATFTVVLDACILYPQYLRDILLEAAERDLYRPVWSAPILDELERTLLGNEAMTVEQAARLRSLMVSRFEEALAEPPATLVAAMTNHPKDRHVLAAAVHEGATVVVTANLKDFLAADLAPHGVEAKGPDAFLVDLFHLHPSAMRDVVAT